MVVAVIGEDLGYILLFREALTINKDYKKTNDQTRKYFFDCNPRHGSPC